MNRMKLLAGMSVCLGWALGTALAGETFVVVRLADMVREDTYQVMSGDEFKQLQKQLALEERNFQKALTQAADEWRKDEMNKKDVFPGGRLSARKIIGQAETFPSRDKADARLSLYEDREANKRARELDKTKKARTEAEKLKEARETDKILLARRAADLVAAKLAALTGGEGPAAGAKPEDKPAAPKPDDKKADHKAGADKKQAGAALNKAL